AGAEDVKVDEHFIEVFTRPHDLEKVRRALENEHPIASADVSLVPKTMLPLSGEAAQGTLRLLDRLEELADVQRIYSNADFSEEALELYRGSLS
ncbi:MAG: YebC/PmpR family DNA-binding transcriptional regulator, partial [Chloroflexota bacterium]